MTQSLVPAAPAALTHQRIDPARLRANMAKFAGNRISENTRRTYAAQWRAFDEWCAANGLPSMPAEEATAAAYVEHLYDAGKARSSIDVARAAIGKAHAEAGCADPFAGLGEFMRSVVRTLAGEGRTTPRVKPTITLDDLRAMSRACGDGLLGLRDRALILVAYAGWMRRAEPLKLRADAMEWGSDYVKCWLGVTKTDQTGTAREFVTIPRVDDAEVCGYRALRAWLDASGIAAGPVFVKLTYGRLTAVPLARDNYVNEIVERVAKRAGLDTSRIAPHRAFRATPITQAVRAGENPVAVSKRARHKSFETTKKYVALDSRDDVRVGRASY